MVYSYRRAWTSAVQVPPIARLPERPNFTTPVTAFLVTTLCSQLLRALGPGPQPTLVSTQVQPGLSLRRVPARQEKIPFTRQAPITGRVRLVSPGSLSSARARAAREVAGRPQAVVVVVVVRMPPPTSPSSQDRHTPWSWGRAEHRQRQRRPVLAGTHPSARMWCSPRVAAVDETQATRTPPASVAKHRPASVRPPRLVAPVATAS